MVEETIITRKAPGAEIHEFQAESLLLEPYLIILPRYTKLRKVSDVVRSKLSKIDLDKAFLQQSDLQSAIEAKLTDSLADYG